MNKQQILHFAVSIGLLSNDLTNSLDSADWEDASDTLDLIESDTKKLRAFVNRMQSRLSKRSSTRLKKGKR